MKLEGLLAILLVLSACSEKAKPPPPPPPPPKKKVAKPPAPPPIKEASKEEAEKALAQLEVWVKPGAMDPKNAWAMAHGVGAFGKDLKATDGRLAIDVIVQDYVIEKDGQWVFPVRMADRTPAQSHDGQFPFLFLTAGVEPSHVFKLKNGKKVTLAQLIDSVEKRFVIPTDDKGWHNFAWALMSFQMSDRKKLATSAGREALDQLEKRQAFLVPAYEANQPEKVQKRKQGIYGHHCGGLHFVQASVQAAAMLDADAKARMKKQLDLLLFRWDAERRIYRSMQKTAPEHVWKLIIQELKFYGHILEAYGVALKLGVVENDEATKKKLRQVMGDLVFTIGRMEPAYKMPDRIQLSRQNRYDVVGDGSHAILGMRRALELIY